MPQPWENDPIVGGLPNQAQAQAPGVIYGRPKAPPPVTAPQQQTMQINAAEEERKRLEWEATHKPDGTPIVTPKGGDPVENARTIVDSLGIDLSSDNDRISQLIMASTSGWLQHQTANVYKGITGDATSGMEAIGTLTPISADLTLQMTGGSLGAQISNADREFIKERMGDVANPDKTADERLAAWREVKRRLANSLGIAQGQTATKEVDRDELANVYWLDENGDPVLDDNGAPLGPDGGLGFNSRGEQLGLYGGSTSGSPAPSIAEQRALEEANRLNDLMGKPGTAELRQQGITLGLSDEAAGVGTAIGKAITGDFDVSGNYQLGRDAERVRLEQAREATGGWGTANELLGGLASGGAGVVNTVGQAAKTGAIAGGTGGFGYGEGAQESLANTALGAGGGALLGAGGQKIGEKIARRAAGKAASRDVGSEVAAAGQAEGVTVNRAMVDPSVENRITGVETSMAGGPTLRRGMEKVEGQIASRVGELGPGEVSAAQLGDDMQDALTVFRKDARSEAGNLYTQAERLVGGKTISPQRGIQAIDQQIAELEASGANANKSAIGFLREVREDLSKGMTISGLKNQRSNLRGQISERNLTMTDTERRMNMVLDAVSDDIASGLQGNARALDLYRKGDQIWRDQARFTKQIEQRLVGPRDNPYGAEQTARGLESLMRGDQGRFRRLWAAMPESERQTIATYVAQNLGRNQRGEFSTAFFLRHTGGKTRLVSDDALKTVFGQEGFQSIQNLRKLSEQVNRVTSQYNSSKTGRAGDYRSWLFNLLLGSGGGVAAGGNATGALVGAATLGGIKMGRDMLSARALLSPKITKWVSTAPATASPKAIDAHFARLNEIARAEPALANDIALLKEGIIGAANDNVGLPAAAGNTEENQQKQQRPLQP